MRVKHTRLDIEELLLNWLYWTMTRSFYAAPAPKNILARLGGRSPDEISTTGLPPDAKNDALCNAFNLVMQSAHDIEPEKQIPFLYVYMKSYRPKPIKTLAYELGISSDTIYTRAHQVAPKYYNQAIQLCDLSAKLNREVAGFED